MRGPLGYGRYDDDFGHVGCPRAKSDMTPCVARDGASACATDGRCVGCDAEPADLLAALVREVTEPAKVASPVGSEAPGGATGSAESPGGASGEDR